MKTIATLAIVLLSLFIGCDDRERIAKIERENSELRSELAKTKTSTNDYEMQEKCNHDAKEWLRDNWANSKDTIFMSYNTHYNKEKNACFIVVEHHVRSAFGDNGSWSNVMGLWDVLENNKYASIQEDHLMRSKPTLGVDDSVVECQVSGKKCKTLEEFNQLTRPYLLN